MVFAVVVLVCMGLVVLWCAIARSRPAAWVLLGLSALWLPTNNRHLEGRTLVVLSKTHGITQGDCIGVGAWLLATAVLVWRNQSLAPRGQRMTRGAVTLFACGVVLALGALAAASE